MNTYSLLKQIAEKRNEMTKIANHRGIDHVETIKVSEELDKLIVEHQKLTRIRQSHN